jgi:hypothetical protein
VTTVRQANPPPRGVTGWPVRASKKYGSSWQLLGKVSAVGPIPALRYLIGE